jgi:serine/threonine-protein kinase
MRPGDRLGHYTLTSLLGSGGMGAVYRGTDTSLGRDVAIKVLPADLAADPDRLERFRREARALAAITHPNIVTVYSVEHVDDVHFLTMELVEGDALDRLIGGQPMPIERALEVARAVVDALMAAHDKGIVHRDLKPANVILSKSGQTKVLDFGLAKVSAGRPDTAKDSQTFLATEAGIALGTPAYMSPEQVSGLDVDQRTDIFSFGVLLYEMLTGVRPFAGRSSAELATSILRDAPQPVQALRATVSSDVARVVARCLEKNVASRFSSMADVRRLLHGGEPPAAADVGPSIAVLPFKNLSTDPDSEFFSDGLAEEILNALAQIDGLRVAARTSSFSFKGKSADLAEIGTKLRVSTVLEGSVRRAGNRIRVTAQLVDVSGGFQLWSERYDRELADIFDVQDEIARAIAGKLKVTLAAGGPRLVRAATASLPAYELYLRGRALLLKRGRHVVEGTECLKRAVELDPEFAPAWAGLADTFTVRGYWGNLSPAETMPKALTAARRAVELDPSSAEAHCALAMPLLLWERDYDASEAAFRRSIELNPNYTQGRGWHGLFSLQWVRGRSQEGVAEVRRAYENDPLSAYATSILGQALAGAGGGTEAIAMARLGAERDPDALLGHWCHGLAAHWAGYFEESVGAFTKAAAVSGRAPFALAHMASTYADWGKPDQARALYDELRSMQAQTYVPCTSVAVAASASGDMDAAMNLARQACDEREPILLLMARLFPDLQRLREDPRFQDVLRRLALPA